MSYCIPLDNPCIVFWAFVIVLPYYMLFQYLHSHSIEEILYGNRIRGIHIVRKPISSTVQRLLDVISCCAIQPSMERRNIQKLYHIKVIIYTDHRVLQLEKDKVVKLRPYKENFDAERICVDLRGREISVSSLIERTRSFMGDDRFYKYSSSSNNCQDFALSVLLANCLYDEAYELFIKQDIGDLFSPCMVATSNCATDCMRRIYKRCRQGIIPRKYKK